MVSQIWKNWRSGFQLEMRAPCCNNKMHRCLALKKKIKKFKQPTFFSYSPHSGSCIICLFLHPFTESFFEKTNILKAEIKTSHPLVLLNV